MFKVGDRIRLKMALTSKGFERPAGFEATVIGLTETGVLIDDPLFDWPWDFLWWELVEIKTVRYIADDDKLRKDFPLFDGLFGYFPNALCEVARWSKHSNQQHNPGEPMHWAKDKSTDHKNKIMRHTLDAEQLNKDGFYEAIGAAWRALALAEEILVASGKPWGANVK